MLVYKCPLKCDRCFRGDTCGAEWLCLGACCLTSLLSTDVKQYAHSRLLTSLSGLQLPDAMSIPNLPTIMMVVSTHNLTKNHALAVCSSKSACMDLHSDTTFFFFAISRLSSCLQQGCLLFSAVPACYGGSLFSCLCFPPHWRSTELTDVHSVMGSGI